MAVYDDKPKKKVKKKKVEQGTKHIAPSDSRFVVKETGVVFKNGGVIDGMKKDLKASYEKHRSTQKGY